MEQASQFARAGLVFKSIASAAVLFIFILLYCVNIGRRAARAVARMARHTPSRGGLVVGERLDLH